MLFVNLPLRFIEQHPHYLDLFLRHRLHPELGLDALALDLFSPARHREIARTFRDAGLSCAVHLPFFDLHPGSLDPLVRSVGRQRLLQAVDAARVYEPVHFVAHLDGQHLWPPDMREQWLVHSLETWEMVMERAGGVPLFLENVFEPTPAQHEQVLRELGGRAGACLDIGHWHAFANGVRKADLADWLLALGGFPMHLHLHDNDGSADQHLGLGEGAIPWDELWDWLRSHRATATLEPHTERDFHASWAYLNRHGLRNLF